MIRIFDENQFGIFAQQFQGSIELHALGGGYIHVFCAVYQQERGIYFVRIEKRALVDVNVFSVPGERVCGGVGAVTVAPIAVTPIAGDGGDTCVCNGACEYVCLRSEVHGCKSAVGSAHASDFGRVNKRMGF